MKCSLPLVLVLPCLAFASDPLTRGKALFDDNCSMCHGPLGDGQGELAAELPLRPRNFRGEPLQWGNELASVITTVTHGRSDVMPSFDSVLTPAEISDVATWVWSIIPPQLKRREFTAGPHLPPTTRVFLVHQRGRSFRPAALVARVGDMVVFVNDDDVVHEVHELSPGSAGKVVHSQKPLQWDRVVLTAEGSLLFGCALHPAMRLELTVNP